MFTFGVLSTLGLFGGEGFSMISISSSLDSTLTGPFVEDSSRLRLFCTFLGLEPDEDATFWDFCFKNIAWIPSFRSEMGWIKVEDSVPTLPTSFGTW